MINETETETEIKIEQNISGESGEELYRRFQTGDSGAFKDFVTMHEDELFRFINSIVHDYHEAKHLTIETFAQLVVNTRKFMGKSSVKTYLFAIGKNLSIRYIKMRTKEQHLSYEEVIEVLIDDDEAPHSYLERDENKKYLLETMRDLKEEYRAVLILLYFEDMSYIQAGRVMNKSERQIKDLAYRAKSALKKKLEIKGFTYN